MSALTDKRVIVTVGANRIGRAIVERFVAEDARVAFCDIDEIAGAALAARLGEAAVFTRVDRGDMVDVRRFVDGAVNRAGGVDVLVNNAGIAVSKTNLDLTDDEFDLTMAANLKAAFGGDFMGGPRPT